MTLDEYQKKALTTASSTGDEFKDLMHWILGLTGEAGEVAEKLKKIIRDKEGVVSKLDRDDLVKELGMFYGTSLYLPIILMLVWMIWLQKMSLNCKAEKAGVLFQAVETTANV